MSVPSKWDLGGLKQHLGDREARIGSRGPFNPVISEYYCIFNILIESVIVWPPRPLVYRPSPAQESRLASDRPETFSRCLCGLRAQPGLLPWPRERQPLLVEHYCWGPGPQRGGRFLNPHNQPKPSLAINSHCASSRRSPGCMPSAVMLSILHLTSRRVGSPTAAVIRRTCASSEAGIER
jgi:hypothetical protein